MPRCFFALTVDTECDKAEHWRTRYPIRCANIIEELPQLFHRRAVALGLRPTYLLSPEVLRDRDAVAALRSLEGTYELGTHLHGEYIEPEADWNAPGTYAMQCNYSAEVEWQKLRNLTALFQEVIGESPRSFRAGRYGIAARSIAMLERLGYWVDSSVTPYKWWAPNVRFLDAPVLPYTPSTEDLCRAGQGQLLELPGQRVPGRLRLAPQRMAPTLQPIPSRGGVALAPLEPVRLGPASSALLRCLHPIAGAAPHGGLVPQAGAAHGQRCCTGDDLP
jgi:hypothetical protein